MKKEKSLIKRKPLIMGVLCGLGASITLILLKGGYMKVSLEKIIIVKLFLMSFYIYLFYFIKKPENHIKLK